MRIRHKKRLKLRKNTSFVLKILLIFLLILFMQNNKYLKQFIIQKSSKYVKKYYIKKESILPLSINKNNNSDEIFAIKEEKNISPLIYIYNTHQSEKYLSSNESYRPTVMNVAQYLNEKFNESELPSIFENKSINNVLNENNWSYGSSYKVSRSYMEEAYKSSNTIKYFFDIHRDAGSHSYTTLCVSDKCYAKILFLIGLENPNYLENQKYAEDLNKKLNEKVDGLSKGILQKQGKKVNGVYNQDLSPRVILIEIGGENNTMDEVYNTLNVLSEVLIDYIKEEIENGY